MARAKTNVVKHVAIDKNAHELAMTIANEKHWSIKTTIELAIAEMARKTLDTHPAL